MVAGQDGDIPVKIEESLVDTTPKTSFTSMLPGQLFPGGNPGGLGGSADSGHFELDEHTLRSLQQFMESQGLHPDTIQNMGSTDGIGKTETTLAQGLAEHYLPSRQEIKIETEEERKLRAHRVRLENRERKKRWREQNNERNKDNDLRCRVNKRANSIFGPHASPDKNAFIEAEFAKRQQKRRGKAPSPSAEGSDGTDNMYATILNNPEFANILMNLLAQKGLDPGDTETSAQLLELLKSNPEFLRGFLTAPTEESMEQPIKNDPMEMPQLVDHIGMDTHLGLPTALQFETLSMETALAQEVSPTVVPMAPQRPAPIPCLGIKTDEEIVPPRPSIPLPAPNPVPSLPMYIPPTVPLSIQQPATSHNRVQAFGFPPMMSQSR